MIQKSSFHRIAYKVKEEKQNAKILLTSGYVFNTMVYVEQYFKKLHLRKLDCDLHISKDEIFDIAW